MSAFEPTNPDILGFNLEGGTISLSTPSDVKMTIDAANQRVGIGTEAPEESLHIKADGTRNKLRISGNLYGNAASTYSLSGQGNMFIYSGAVPDTGNGETAIKVNHSTSFTEVFRLPYDGAEFMVVPAGYTIAIFATVYATLVTASDTNMNYEITSILKIINTNGTVESQTYESKVQYSRLRHDHTGDSFKYIDMYTNKTVVDKEIYVNISFYTDEEETVLNVEKNSISIIAFVLPTI